jgi:glycosyltransferase involved in cell wall biosynthesis
MRSVVLACCQGERFIGEQLDSILPQLSPEDEVIVSDDASTDSTVEFVAQRSDPRIRILRNDLRAGCVGNFQRAIREARGDIIYFSDQDDVWLPGKVQTLDAALRRKSCVCSDAIVVDERLRQIYPSYFGWRRVRSFSTLSVFLRPPIVGATIACTGAYLGRLLPLPENIPQDFWITFNAAWDGELEIIRTPLILYRRHSAAASPSATSRRRRFTEIARERIRLIASSLHRRFGL